MKAKYDRVRTDEYTPQPIAIHTHEVRWSEHGFTIIKRCYCQRAAAFELGFQQRMGKDAMIVTREANA